MNVKSRIKSLAMQRGIGLATLDATLGFGNGTIGKWDKFNPSVDKVKKVADYFGVSVDYLLTGEQKEPREENPRVAPFEKLFNELSAEQQMVIVQQMLELRSKQ